MQSRSVWRWSVHTTVPDKMHLAFQRQKQQRERLNAGAARAPRWPPAQETALSRRPARAFICASQPRTSSSEERGAQIRFRISLFFGPSFCPFDEEELMTMYRRWWISLLCVYGLMCIVHSSNHMPRNGNVFMTTNISMYFIGIDPNGNSITNNMFHIPCYYAAREGA